MTWVVSMTENGNGSRLHNVLARKMGLYTHIGSAEAKALLPLQRSTCQFAKNAFVIRQDEKMSYVYIVEDGWAIRYRLMEDGRRQIVSLILPGDFMCFH